MLDNFSKLNYYIFMDKTIRLEFSGLNTTLLSHDKNATIYDGDTFIVLEKLLTRFCPHQKALFILNKSEENIYSDFLENIKSKAITPLVCVIENSSLNVDSASVMFTYPEDVRVVVCFDYSLFDYAVYYSNANNIRLILALSGVDNLSALKPVLKIKNGNKTDHIKVNPKTSVIFDTQKIKNSASSIKNLYETVVSLSLSLIEYRILRLINVKPTFKDAYSLIKQSITSVFDITSFLEEQRKLMLALNSLKISVANYITGGEILAGSTYSSYNELLKDGRLILDYSTKILELSTFAFCEMKSSKKVPDYQSRANYLFENFGIDKTDIFSKYLKSAKLFDKYSVKIAEFFSLNKQEILSLISSFKLAKKISHNLPQEKEENIIAPENVYKYFGDLSGAINLCTFLREKGVFELF